MIAHSVPLLAKWDDVISSTIFFIFMIIFIQYIFFENGSVMLVAKENQLLKLIFAIHEDEEMGLSSVVAN